VDAVALAATVAPLLGFSPSAPPPVEQSDYGRRDFAEGRALLARRLRSLRDQ
jgi:hypothetical protein